MWGGLVQHRLTEDHSCPVYRYCDDACALAGWLTHKRSCGHKPAYSGAGGLHPKPDDPW